MFRSFLFFSILSTSLFSTAFSLMPFGVPVKKTIPFVAIIKLDVETIPKNDTSETLYPAHCGATIIKRDLLLTAAHCMIVPAERMTILAGIKDRLTLRGGERRQVSKYLKHENFNETTREDDIALVWLKIPFATYYTIETIELPNELDYQAYRTAAAYGWGLDENGMPVPWLRKAIFYILPYTDEKCENIPSSKQICAIGFEYNSTRTKVDVALATACHGDSGGPLVVRKRVIGIVSKVNSICTLDRPVLFTRVLDYVDWIKRHGGL